MDLLAIPREGVRATAGIARFGVHAALLPARLMLDVAELAAGKVADAIFPSETAIPPPERSVPPPQPRRPAPARGDRGRTASVPRRGDGDRSAAAPRSGDAAPDVQDRNGSPPPAHVDEEATLVMESADPGAAEGVGAEVTVDPPWPNYGRMTATEVIDRIAVAPESVLTVLLLYERSHRARRSVIAASEQALTRLAGR